MFKRITGLVLLLALTAAACGSGSSDAGLASLDDPVDATEGVASLDEPADAVDTVEMDAEEAMLALAECLREQGLEVEDPEIADDGNLRLGSLFRPLMQSGEVDRETINVAMAACEDVSSLITTEFHNEDRSEMEDQLYVYAACMRDNGYEMADPDFSDSDSDSGSGMGKGKVFGDLDRDDPDFQAANAVCSEVFTGSGLGTGNSADGS